MRILIVGSEKQFTLEYFYSTHLKKSAQVSIFPSRDRMMEYHSRNLLNKVLYRFGLSSILNKINSDLLEFVRNYEFDVIWVFKGMEIFPDTLKAIKRDTNTVLVNYNADHPFRHFSRGTGNTYVKESIGLYDHHFTFSKEVLNRIKNEYGIGCTWLPFGYSMSKEPNLEKEPIRKVCFIGNPDKDRVMLIESLGRHNIPTVVYGHGWEKLNLSTSIEVHSAVYLEDFQKVVQMYAVQLNIFRPHNVNSHNMRTFEMPALGAIMLAPASEEHATFFEEGKEALFYSSEQELVEKCSLILNSLSSEKVQQIRKNAYTRSIESGYGYVDRANSVLDEFRILICN